jgi:SPP1 family predicted phage head-tail adaptor
MLSAGQRNHRVRFERRAVVGKSPSGNVLDEWAMLFACWAAFRPRFGRESLEAGRLDATMLGTLTVLRWPATAGVSDADRVVFVAGPYAGKACQIRSIVPTPDNREIEMLLESGVET